MAYSVIGSVVTDVRGRERVTGSALYAVDMSRPFMLIGRTVRSPYPRAKIVSIDTKKAEAVPGVRAVVTSADVPPIPFPSYDIRVLAGAADRYVRFVGDEVAAVAAETQEIADSAAKQVVVEYEQLPFNNNLAASMLPSTPDVESPFYSGNVLPPYSPMVISRGDVETGFAAADVVFEGDYQVPTQVSAAMRPHCCLAEWEGQSLTVHLDTQVMFSRQAELAALLQIPPENIRIISQYIGGSFGEDNIYRFVPLTAILARKTGRPVKMILPHDYSFEASPNKRHAARFHVKLGALRDGTLTAVSLDATYDKGAYLAGGWSVPYVGARGIFQGYRTQNMRYTAYAVFTDNPPAGAFRGYGGVQSNFAVQSAIDDLAAELGLDPTQVQALNCIRQDDVLEIEGNQVDFSKVGGSAFLEAIEQGKVASGWQQKRTSAAGYSHIRTGIGMALLTYGFGHIPDTATVAIVIKQGGQVEVRMGTSDLGGGQRTTMAMIVAEELGASLDDVSILLGDTRYPPAPFQGSFGSRTTFIAGNAARLAAADARGKLLGAASAALGKGTPMLSTRGSRVVVTGSDQGLSFAEVLKAMPGQAAIQGAGTYVHDPVTSKSGFQFGACFAEVNVNSWTGKISVVRLAMVQDYGKVINPLAVSGQMLGSAMQGIGYGLLEDYVLDRASSQSVTRDWLYYRVPTMADVPELDAITLEHPDPRGPFGAKGGGESMMICAHSAIRNAVANATGLRFNSLPITPQMILESLKAKGGQPNG